MSSVINTTDAEKAEEADVTNVTAMMMQRKIYISRK